VLIYKRQQAMRTRARDSNPRLCPSTVSMWWFRAKRLLPSMTNATCCGIGPCFREPISSSRSCLTVHATGGEVANHLCMRESCSDPMFEIVEVPRVGCIATWISWKIYSERNATQGNTRYYGRGSNKETGITKWAACCIRMVVNGKVAT
jgi:hypothetical protein